MTVKIGARLRASNSTAEVIVTKAPTLAFEIMCGGAVMTEDAKIEDTLVADGEELRIGKRYQNANLGVEVLCVNGGAGPLTIDGEPMTVREATTLPSSD